MSRQVILIIEFSCCFIVQARTQNLVPNPSFEIISSCPNNLDQLYLADSWFDPSFCTPDLFNTCNALLAPQNAFGWQQARTGNGYAGIGVYAFFYPSSNINIREFLEVKLNDTLKAGARYCIEFYASLGSCSLLHLPHQNCEKNGSTASKSGQTKILKFTKRRDSQPRLFV
jgi:OmpA-OmpF porin, OOP family